MELLESECMLRRQQDQNAVEAIDRLHTTAESHHRALIVEVMGRPVFLC